MLTMIPTRCVGGSPKCMLCLQTKQARKSSLQFTTKNVPNVNPKLRTLFEEYAVQHNLSSTDWYQVQSSLLPDETRDIIKKAFQGSMYDALSSVFPDVEWYPWKFKHNRVPSSYWNETTRQRKFFDVLGKQIGIQTLDDWYDKISSKLIHENGGSEILKQYNGSPITALITLYPEHNWEVFKFKLLPQGYWKDMTNQKRFFDELGNRLGVKTLDDWYSVLKKSVILEHGGSGMLSRYNMSPQSAVMATYPEHNWVPWKFQSVSQRFWQNTDNHKQFFDELGKILGIQTLDDWYEKLGYDVIVQHGGAGLIDTHGGSPTAALLAVYPQHNWIVWKFKCVPRDFWKDIANQRKFFDDLGSQLGVTHMDDWYHKLSISVIIAHGGRYLLKSFHWSPIAALKATYPDHEWIPWKFSSVPNRFWDDKNNVAKFLAELSEKLSIQTLADWYRVDWIQLHRFGASTLLSKYKGLYNILKEQYPHYPWDSKIFQQGTTKKGQRWLLVTLKKMFPGEGRMAEFNLTVSEIIEDYQHPKAIFPSSGRHMQLDMFIPSKSLAFEYQGQHHFQEVGLFGPTKLHQQRDEEKRVLCAANHIKLIEVPYWWNRSQDSLQELISQS